jgi:hypothetical protein
MAGRNAAALTPWPVAGAVGAPEIRSQASLPDHT